MSPVNVNRARATLRKVNWNRRQSVATIHGHRVYTHDALALLGLFYVDHEQELIVMGSDTFLALSVDQAALWGIAKGLADGSPGIKYINLMSTEYAYALRERAQEVEGIEVRPRDIVDNLHDVALSLVTRAALMVGRPEGVNEAEYAILVEERADLTKRVQDLKERVARLEALLVVANDSILAA